MSEIVGYSVLLIVIGYQLFDKYRTKQELLDINKELHMVLSNTMDNFSKERQDYIDRLSANSFQEYKTQAIRMTKAQNKEDPEHPKMELL